MTIRRLKTNDSFDPLEHNIKIYKDFYREIEKVNKSSVYQLIEDLKAVSNLSVSWDKENALTEINKKFRKIATQQKTINTFESVTRQSLQRKKEEEFDKKRPPIVSKPGNDALSNLMELARLNNKSNASKVSDAEFVLESQSHKLNFLKQIYNCLQNFGLRHDLIPNRPDEKKLFNLYLVYSDTKGKEKKDAIVLLKETELLENYIEPYNSGHSLMFNGSTIEFKAIKTIRVSCSKYQKDEVPLFLKKQSHTFDEKKSVSRIKYFNECESVTDQYINTKNSIVRKTHDDFVYQERMEEILALPSNKFDLKKLIQLCTELNIAHKNDMRFAKAALVRAICDHVPPVFGFATFEQVTSNYKADKNTQSFRGAVKKLYDFFKHVADGIMHSQARAKESLPTKEQLNVAQEMDYLLQELCRILK